MVQCLAHKMRLMHTIDLYRLCIEIENHFNRLIPFNVCHTVMTSSPAVPYNCFQSSTSFEERAQKTTSTE